MGGPRMWEGGNEKSARIELSRTRLDWTWMRRACATSPDDEKADRPAELDGRTDGQARSKLVSHVNFMATFGRRRRRLCRFGGVFWRRVLQSAGRIHAQSKQATTTAHVADEMRCLVRRLAWTPIAPLAEWAGKTIARTAVRLCAAPPSRD